MGPKIEHASVIVFLLLGQFIAHFGLQWANAVWHFLPEKSAWLTAVGIVLGFIAYFAILWIVIGLIFIAGRIGIIDLTEYNKKYPGMR